MTSAAAPRVPAVPQLRRNAVGLTGAVIMSAASGIVEMARELPSAGAFYTYVTRGLGPRAGFVTGGLMFVAYALLPPAEVGLIGGHLQSTVKAEFSANVPWWPIELVHAG